VEGIPSIWESFLLLGAEQRNKCWPMGEKLEGGPAEGIDSSKMLFDRCKVGRGPQSWVHKESAPGIKTQVNGPPLDICTNSEFPREDEFLGSLEEAEHMPSCHRYLTQRNTPIGKSQIRSSSRGTGEGVKQEHRVKSLTGH